MKVGIRVDASPAMGLGHVKRCLALAHALHDVRADVRCVTRDLGVAVKTLVSSAGFPCEVLPAPMPDEVAAPRSGSSATQTHWTGVGWHVDARETCLALRSEPMDWVVVDHYGLDALWHRHVANALTTRIAVIDDLANRALAANLLIDHNCAADHREKYHGRLDEEVPILGGPRYALLGPAYARPAHYVYSDEVRSIGIFMGGIDGGNFSTVALQACRDVAGFTGPIEIVTTHDNPHLRSLEAIARSGSRTELSIDLPHLADFFRRHDLQIGASGGATWERCCVGVPTLAIAVADNQRYVLEPLIGLGVVHAMTDRVPSAESLGREIRYLIDSPDVRKQLAQRARTLVDGRGALRVAEAMRQLWSK